MTIERIRAALDSQGVQGLLERDVRQLIFQNELLTAEVERWRMRVELVESRMGRIRRIAEGRE